MKKNKLIGDRSFYKMIMVVAMPIMLQNLITNFVSLLDNFMVGKLGTEQMSGVSIANQILLIIYLATFGALNGIGIYGAQFYGKGNTEGLRYSLRFKIYTSAVIGAAACIVLALFRTQFINLFLHDENAGSVELTLAYASRYILIMLIGIFPYALAQAFATSLRETGDTLTPMVAGFCAVFSNVVLNYILIFGKFGAPALGVDGAAIATVVSRFVEVGILIVYAIVKKERFPYIKGLFKGFSVPHEYAKGFTAKGASLMGNEILWSCSQVAMSIAYSLHSLDVVAAYSISSTVVNLFFILSMSLGISAGIIVGKELGAGNHSRAIDYARQITAFSVVSCLFMSALLILVGGRIPQFYNTTDTAKSLAVYFITISSIFMPVDTFNNASYFIIRSGGKTLVTMLFDAGSMWLLSVPVAFLLYYAFACEIKTVYLIVVALMSVKAIVGYFLVRSKMWVNTIV